MILPRFQQNLSQPDVQWGYQQAYSTSPKILSSEIKPNWLNLAERIQALPPYVFARLDELKARAREQGLAAAQTALQLPDIYSQQVQARYQRRRDFFIQG